MSSNTRIFEFFIERKSSPLIVVRSSFGLQETVKKVVEQGFEPLSYTELDECDIDESDIEYTFV